MGPEAIGRLRPMAGFSLDLGPNDQYDSATSFCCGRASGFLTASLLDFGPQRNYGYASVRSRRISLPEVRLLTLATNELTPSHLALPVGA